MTVRCPACQAPVDVAITMNGQDVEPNAGDVTVCTSCSWPLVFSTPHTVRLMTNADVQYLFNEQPEALRELSNALELTRMQQLHHNSLN